MAAFIKHLVTNWGADLLVDVYGRTRDGGVVNRTDPMLAIDDSFPDELLTVLWSALIAAYSAGGLYGPNRQ